MFLEYIPIAILIVLAIGLAALVVILGHAFGPRRPTDTKSMPYESGMNPIGPGTRRVPVRFYLVAVLFIHFDCFWSKAACPGSAGAGLLGRVRCHRNLT